MWKLEIMEEIRNKVKESGLLNLDLALFKPDNTTIASFDIADYLWQGLVLKEKEFRAQLAAYDWSFYNGKNVFIHCSADAIIPTWAYMLIGSRLEGVAAFYMAGSEFELQKELIRSAITAFDISQYNEERIIIKGCSDIVCPEFAMVLLMSRLQPVSKSIMYGEPCSTVPLYKAPKK